mgnify:CR=1 FL=1
MSKNIIICCDGTGNQFGQNNSNVVKLYSVIRKVEGEQIAYYDPGVGTYKPQGLGFPLRGTFKKIAGLATGYGLYQNVYEAYSYLMENFEPGDQVYLFGFSRGAYTVRVLSGFIFMMGLLEKGCQNLIPYAFQIYARRKPNFRTAGKFKSRFARECPIRFMGIWDTVSSVGYFGNWKSYPYTRNNENVKTIRHALAIDERRAFYTQNKLGKEQEDQSIREVWFAGVHSDVGGSYAEEESGLAKLALQWMLNEAAKEGLQVDPGKYEKTVLRTNSDMKGPDPKGKLHKSLASFWYIAEIIPKTKYSSATGKRSWYIPLGSYRTIPDNAYIHESVIQRKAGGDYAPPNIPAKNRVEPILETIYVE